jgi:serine/threonine protein kinase
VLAFLGVCYSNGGGGGNGGAAAAAAGDLLPKWIITERQPYSLHAFLRLPGMHAAMGLADVTFVVADVVEGLCHLHSLGMVHRDLKPKNVLVGPGGAKVADLGTAKLIGERRTRYSCKRALARSCRDSRWHCCQASVRGLLARHVSTVCVRARVCVRFCCWHDMAGIAARTAQHTMGPGTAVYHPPEVLQGRYSAAIDVFSLGLLALEVALAESPRRQGATDPVDADQRRRVLRAYPSLRALMDGCLADRSDRRPSR